MKPKVSFYDEKRWNNWISKFREMNLEKTSEEDLSSFLINMMDDVVVALLKVVRSFEREILDKEEAKKIIREIGEIIAKPVKMEDELKEMHIQSIQNALFGALTSFEKFIDNPKVEKSIEELLREAVEAEKRGEYERALELVSEIGVKVLRGESLPDSLLSIVPDGMVMEWLDGIDSIAAAMTLDVTVEVEDGEEEEEF
jgi:hypothetical protein